MSRFVSIPSNRLIAMVERFGAIEGVSLRWIRKGNERVAQFEVDGRPFLFYTSAAWDSQQARKRGQDAARVVFGRNTRRILRTAPQCAQDRAGVWLERVRTILNDTIDEIRSAPCCPMCRARMVRRASKFGEFWGCPSYPKCKGTRKD